MSAWTVVEVVKGQSEVTPEGLIIDLRDTLARSLFEDVILSFKVLWYHNVRWLLHYFIPFVAMPA